MLFVVQSRRKNVTVLKPGIFCRLRSTLPMNRCVVVAVERAAHTVVVAADLQQNMAAAITSDLTRAAAVASVIADHIGVVVASNTAGNILRILRMRWISQVLISLTAPVLLDWMDIILSIMYRVLCSCKPVSVLYTYAVISRYTALQKLHMYGASELGMGAP